MTGRLITPLLQRRAVVPALDARTLSEKLHRVEKGVAELRDLVHHEVHGLGAVDARLDGVASELRRQMVVQGQRHQAELDRIGLEMERALEKLTTDQEVLSGLRAFLHMVREGASAPRGG